MACAAAAPGLENLLPRSPIHRCAVRILNWKFRPFAHDLGGTVVMNGFALRSQLQKTLHRDLSFVVLMKLAIDLRQPVIGTHGAVVLRVGGDGLV